jgi:hypothetical protein
MHRRIWRRELSWVLALLILVPASSIAQVRSASTEIEPYEEVGEFLETRSAEVLSRRGGKQLARETLTPERVGAVIEHARTHGHDVELTPQRVLAYASLYREGDDLCDMATIVERIAPLLVPLAIWVGKTVVQEIATEFVFSRITGEPFSWKEVAKATAISAVTGGLGGSARKALKFRRLYSHGLTWDTSVGILISDSLRARSQANSFAHGFASEAVGAILRNEIDSRAGCLDPLQQYGPLTTTVAVLETWGTECVADALLETYEAELVEIQQTLPALSADPDPVVPLSVTVSDGTYFTPILTSSGVAEVDFTFMPTETGVVVIEVGAVNEGQEVIFDTSSLSVSSAQLFSLLESTVTLPAVDLLTALPGDDREFAFFVRYTRGSFVTSHWGTTDDGFVVYVDGPGNTAPVTMLSHDATGQTVRFYGSYLDVDSDPASQLLLQIDGPGGRQEIDLRGDLVGADPAAQQDFDRTLQLQDGIYAFRLLSSDGTYALVNGDVALRVSSSAPQVEIELSESEATLGEMVAGTVTVTDSLGPVPGVEVSLQTDLRSTFFDVGGEKVRKVTTGGNGVVSFRYRPDFSGSHTVLAMEPSEHQFDWTTLSVPGAQAGWTAEWSFSRDPSVSDESSATYDVQVFIQYQGINLDPGDYVFFSANHGSFQDESDQVGVSSIATNRYTLTRAEADSGSEVLTIELPKYGVSVPHAADLAVGEGAPFVPVRTTTLPGTGDEPRSFAVAYSEDGRYVAYVQNQTSVVIMNLDDLSTVRTVTPPGDDLNCLAFSPDGESIAAGDRDGYGSIIQVATGSVTSKSMTNGHADISNIDWYSADRLAIATLGGGSTNVYAARVLFADAALNDQGSFTRPELTTTDDLHRVECHAGAGLCAATTGYGETRWYLFTTGGGYLDSRVHPDDNAYWALAFNAAGNRLFVGGDDANGATVADLYTVSGSGASDAPDPPVGSSDVYAAEFFFEEGDELLAVGGRTLLEVFPDTGGGVLRSTDDPGYTRDESYYLAFLPGPKQLVAVTNPLQTYYNVCGDDSGPSLGVPNPGELPYLQGSVTLEGDVTDESGVKSLKYRVDGSSWSELTIDAEGRFSVVLDNLPVGATQVDFHATDNCLNVSELILEIVRRDDLQPPAVSQVAVDPGRGGIGTSFAISARVVDFGAGVASVSATVKTLSGVPAAIVPMTSQGADLYLGAFDSTGHAGGVYLVDVSATDASASQNGGTALNGASFSLCALASSLDLSATSVTSAVTYEACESIAAGDGFRVETGGDVVFRAGESVVLRDGFAVDSGGTFRVVIDPEVGNE